MPASDHIWRPLGMMHKVFAGSAIVLFVSTIIMMVVDEDREWRHYQAEAERLRYLKLQEEAEQFSEAEYQRVFKRLDDAIKATQAELDGVQSQVAELQADLDTVLARVEYLQRESKDKNADRDVARANYDLGIRDALPEGELQQLRLAFDNAQETALDFVSQSEAALTSRDEIQAELDALEESVATATTELADFQFQQTQIQEQMNLLQPESWFAALKRDLKTWPIINGFNPEITLQDKQDWIPDLTVQYGMARVARFDRCRACHVHIDNFEAGGLPAFPHGEFEDGDYPHPFSSHPRSDLFVLDSSPHPKTDFGCTVCHDGDGSGTSFQTAEHTPDDPNEADHWEEDHDWHSNHFWEYPMLPTQFIESSCLKCHHNVVELGINEQYGATAPQLFEGYNLIAEYGCFGCHEINGFDGAEQIGPDLRLEPNSPEELAAIEADPNQVPGRMRKVGPSLRHIADKTTPEFIAFWTEMPSRFRPDTRMPQFFNLTNQTDPHGHLDPLAEQLQPVELAGIAAYLTENSEALELDTPAEGYTPDPVRGRHLFSRRGCLACHNHDDPDFAGIDSDFGPNLSRIHEKIRPGQEGFDWLYTWLRDPTQHHTRTRMPNLFLTPEGENDTYVDPAADIAAFLLEGGPGEFPSLELAPAYFGVVLDEDYTAEEAQELGFETPRGVRILSVLQGSAAERTTTLSSEDDSAVRDPLKLGDILLSVDGTTIENGAQLDELIAGFNVGEELPLTIWREGAEQQRLMTVSDALTDLTRLYLSKAVSSGELAEILESGIFKRRQRVVAEDGSASWEYVPVDPETMNSDEIELAQQSEDEDSLDEETLRHRQLVYVGRRTISRYGCYGCHDIPGFEEARPIGTALQDWGRKDTSKLSLEHIEEWLHHHGEPDGSSTHERIEEIVTPGRRNNSHEDRMEAFFYESLMHHGRPGFLWQKLRQPRSYDYRKVETKGWDERLRMPQFPFEESQIESIATFVLGLVADPPSSEYLYQPEGADYARIEGERLLRQFNCASCHMLEMPGFRYEADLRELVGMTRTELEDWFGERADPLADGTILQPALANVQLPDDFELPEEIDAELARRLSEQFVLEQGSLAARATTVPVEGADPLSEEAAAVSSPLRTDDVLLSVGDTVIENGAQLDALIADQEVGTDLVLTIWRSGTEEQRLITVSDRLTDLPPPYLGVVIDDDFTAEEAEELELEATQGVHILDVLSPSLDSFLSELKQTFGDEEGPTGAPGDDSDAQNEGADTQRYVIADTEAYYRQWLEAISPDQRAEAIARERVVIEHMEDFMPNAQAFLEGRLLGVSDASVQIAPLIGRLAQVEVEDDDEPTPLQEWLDEHHELLLVDRLPVADLPESVRAVLSLKPPVSYGSLIESSDGMGFVEAHGLVSGEPDPEETDPDYRQYVLDVWENLEVGGRYKLMGVNTRLLVQEDRLEEALPGRGGEFAQWLVPQLVDDEMAGDFSKSWQAAPPPLYLEGTKVQTPWLYRFLLNPEQIRYTPVLRMPRFNMSETEARNLANYFAAVDGQPFPYQDIDRQAPEYLASRSVDYQAEFPGEGDDYLFTAWQTLNAPLCVKCHSVGGRPYQGSDPTKDIRGPNLELTQNRLRPEWVQLWLYKPFAITSYTSMPSNFAANQEQFHELFAANPEWQIEGITDALMNYYHLMEQHGVTIFEPPMTEPAEGARRTPRRPVVEEEAGNS